jgi:hypothetical protein
MGGEPVVGKVKGILDYKATGLGEKNEKSDKGASVGGRV